jgi:ABC-type oligopeptide transport system substrate-binding subunit
LSAQIPDRENESGSNVAGYVNPTYDAVCQEALRALPGHPAYRDARRQAQVIFSQDLPAVPLFLWPRVTVLRPRVLNFTLDATALGDLGDVERLDVE